MKGAGVRLFVYPVVIAVGVLLVIVVVAFMNRTAHVKESSPRFYIRIQSPGAPVGPWGRDFHIAFAGSIMSTKDGRVTSHSISGSSPDTFDVEGDSVSVAIQKKSPGRETLRVEVEKDNKVLSKASSDAEFGMVTVATK